MNVIFLVPLLLLAISPVLGQGLTRVSLEFEVDGKAISTADLMSVGLYLIDEENGTLTIMMPSIDSSSFVLPRTLRQGRTYMIVARYDQRYLALGKHASESLQSPKWVVGHDMRPFDQNYPIDPLVVDETKGVVYLKLFPPDSAEGYVVMQTVSNPRIFYRDSERLACPCPR